MKKPDLSFNHYYPYYTLSFSGKNTNYNLTSVVVHISLNEAISIKIEQKIKLVTSIKVKKETNRIELDKIRKEGGYISYVQYSKYVAQIYGTIKRALKKMSSTPAYSKVMIDTVYTKVTNKVVFEFDYQHLRMDILDMGYKIVNGKRVKLNRAQKKHFKDYLTFDEKTQSLKKITALLDVMDHQVNYIPIDNDEFDMAFHAFWNSLVPFFETPKSIRKLRYNCK